MRKLRYAPGAHAGILSQFLLSTSALAIHWPQARKGHLMPSQDLAERIESANAADPAFRKDILAGLSTMPKATPARWLYDKRGSELRSEEHTSELQSLMRISYAVFCLKKKKASFIK